MPEITVGGIKITVGDTDVIRGQLWNDIQEVIGDLVRCYEAEGFSLESASGEVRRAIARLRLQSPPLCSVCRSYHGPERIHSSE